MIVNAQHGSTSSLQRRFKIGYSRAGRIMDMLEEKGIVGPQNGSKPREVLVDASELEQIKALEDNFEPGPIAPSAKEVSRDDNVEDEPEEQTKINKEESIDVIEEEIEDAEVIENKEDKNFDSADLIEEDIE